MKSDIHTRKDIISLVDSFYYRVKTNPIIGPIFTDVVKLDFNLHLPIMYDFWSTVLLSEQSYSGNPMEVHLKLSTITPLYKTHFDEWLSLFIETVDDLFVGEKAEEAKYRAKNIAGLMQHKIDKTIRQI
ncbi:MAG: group III truncated hemoglobin [Saprospiraceae bacterium]